MFILKGTITLNIEVDYGTILDPNNQGAVYLFTGAKTIEEMVKVHMDALGEELGEVIKRKPLTTYKLEGRLQKDTPQPVEEQVEESVEEIIEDPLDIEDEMPEEYIVEEVVGVEDELPEPMPEESRSFELVESLEKAVEHVSLELGIPQKIKVNGELMAQLEVFSKDDVRDGVIDEYKGFPVELEGMEEAFIILYKTYGGTDIKFYS